MEWKVEYYSEELREKIFSLPLGTFAKYEMIVERLEKYGPNVQRLPHMRHLVNGLWEIRAIAADGSARIFYCWRNDNVFLMLHSFMKKSQETPKRELDKALRRMKEVKNGK